MLASKFSGRWDESLEKDKDGDFFINQEFSLFRPMLAYLRKEKKSTEKYPMKSPNDSSKGLTGEENSIYDFYGMIEYYGMTDGIYPTKLIINSNTFTRSKDSVEFIHSKKINAKEWATFSLFQEGHSRKIKSYEVTLGDDVKHIQIGWSYRPPPRWNTFGESVKDVSQTYALDLTNNTFLINGTSNPIVLPIGPFKHKKGTTVRAQNYGTEWYIDGEIKVFPSSTLRLAGLESLSPLISIKGEMEITSIQLED